MLGTCPSFARGNADKLNLGIIGPGGRGGGNLGAVSGENIVALCDVDEKRAAQAMASYPQARYNRDFRRMLDVEKHLDAVVVSTPDHTHAVASVMAMKRGLHVYCEKPLAHSIHEVRAMKETAATMGVATQMGIQGHAYPGTREAVEVVRSGALGPVRELHVWTDRPAGWWPQGVTRPVEVRDIPESLSWDLWLGPVPWRPYHPVYVPFKWRGRWDFGTGAIGDMGIHNFDTAFWALELGLPTSVEVLEAGDVFADTPPRWSTMKLQFPARGSQPAVEMFWYDGGKRPAAELFQGAKIEGNGSLMIGEKGTLYTRTWHGGSKPEDWHLLLPEKEFVDYEPPTPTLPRVQGHHQEWLDACRGSGWPSAHFGYAAVSTESMLLGALALRLGRPIEWYAGQGKVAGCAEADAFIHPEYRRNWEL